MAANRPDAARLWSERYVGSQAPLLRRLAIHTLSAQTDLSSDDKIAWLLELCDIHETAARHELFRAVGSAYPQAGQEQRQALFTAIANFRWPREDEPDQERLESYHRYTWHHWLHTADPRCELAKQALDGILASYPDFQPSEHPDFTTWTETWEGAKSLWSADALLASPAAEMLQTLLTYQPTNSNISEGYDRFGMLNTLTEAVKNNPAWGIDLADGVAALCAWDSDLWHYLFRAWREVEFDRDELNRVLSHLSTDELHRQHSNDISDMLFQLIQKENVDSVFDELTRSYNAIAVRLQPYADGTEVPNSSASVAGEPHDMDWLFRAINHPSGTLAQFWIQSIALWHRRQETPPQSLNDEYRSALSAIMQSPGITGKLGRTILASRFHFLLYVDEAWAVDNLLPLFQVGHEDFQPAWEGFLAWGHIAPLSVAERLRQPFLDAIERINHELSGEMRRRFMEYYTAMLTWFVTEPNDEWITKLFNNGDANVRHEFANQIGYRLRSLGEAQQTEWWNVWLKDYWENRLLGFPAPLDNAEIAAMLGWTNHLSAIYPEAVDLAVRMRSIPLEREFFVMELDESELPDKDPESVAKLLAHLGQADHSPWFWHSTKGLFDRLLQSNLDTATEVALKETMAKIGFLD